MRTALLSPIMSLDSLFRPSSVAVVGASKHEGKIGNVILRNLSQDGFRLYPVNPKDEEILGLRSYPSLKDLPEVPDLAILAVPAEATVAITQDCAQLGVPMVVNIASGFSETGPEGRALEHKLLQAIKGTGTRMLGPNTMGALVPRNSLDTFFIPKERSPRPGDGNIALISQSGSVLLGAYETAEEMGTGLSAAVGLGNKADLDENDLLEYFGADQHTNCIAMYLESFADGKRFMSLCHEISPRKPIVAVKVGRTERGSRAASSHTGALARGSDALVNGVFKQFGVTRAYDEQEMLDMAKALSYIGHIDGDRVVVLGSAGGFGVIASDYIGSCDTYCAGMEMANISDEGREAIKRDVDYYASAENPIDLTGGATDQMFDESLEILQTERGVDVILVLLQLQTPQVTNKLVEVVARWGDPQDKPLVVCCIGGWDTRPITRRLEASHIPTYTSLRRAVWAIRALYNRGLYLKRIEKLGQHVRVLSKQTVH